jgi:FkbM family methyltransferase
LDWYVYFFGAYARRELFMLRDLLRIIGNRTVFDIGANVGHHSLFLSRYASCIHAFEPWATVRDRLLEKITLNSIANIVVHPVGIGNEDALLTYYAPTTANTGCGSFSPAHDAGNRPIGTLQVVQGDTYLDSRGIREVGLIKIDVEGWEKYALLGLRRTIARNRPIVSMEFSATTRNSLSGEKELRSCLPEDFDILAFNETHVGAGLIPFDFSRVGNIVLGPRESMQRLSNRLGDDAHHYGLRQRACDRQPE